MIVTYIREKDKYVNSNGRIVSTADYGADFYNCGHDFMDSGRRGTTVGPNGKHISAAAYQCSKCKVFTVVEFKKRYEL